MCLVQSPVTANYFMEDCEEGQRNLQALLLVLVQWQHLHDWHHGSEKSSDVQVTMKTEKGSHLPFLDINAVKPHTYIPKMYDYM
jgi:hypothetical protein